MAHRINIERLRPVIHSQFRPTVELTVDDDNEGIKTFPPSSYELDTDRAYVEANAQAVVESIKGWRRKPNKIYGARGTLKHLVKWVGLDAH